MYEEKQKGLKIDFKKILIKFLILLIVVFIVIWIISLFTNNKNKITKNFETMKEVATKYFTEENLPKEINTSKKITLKDMQDAKLIGKLKDENNKPCSLENSYASVLKLDEENYTLQVNLDCGKTQKSYVNTFKVLAKNSENNQDENNNVIGDTNENNQGTNNQLVDSTTKPNNNNNNESTPVVNQNSSSNTQSTNNQCLYGSLNHSSMFPFIYTIKGNCAVSKDDYLNSNYVNIVNDFTVAEYKKLVNEMANIKTAAKIEVLPPQFNPVYNVENTGLVGYQAVFKVIEHKTYYDSTVYEYYLKEDGSRKIIIDNLFSL